MPTATDGQWRAYLTGEPTDLARLRRELSTGVVTVAEDDSGTYLQADEFEVCADADEVRVAADPLVVLLNGMASLSFGGYRRVALSGTIAREKSNYLFMEDSFRLSDELSVVRVVADITAEGVVTTVDGTLPDSPGLSSMQRRLASIATHPELADVYRLLGREDPAWDELYKVYELLSKAVGGEQKLPKRTGVARERIQLLKDNSNNPELTGDDARHASLRRIPVGASR